jgi:hypothetical protein
MKFQTSRYTVTIEDESSWRPSSFSEAQHAYTMTEDQPHYGQSVEVGSGYLDACTLDTPQPELMRSLFERHFHARGHGGYPALFVGDGDYCCVSCGLDALLDEDDDQELTYTVDWASSDNLSGMWCDRCNEWIYEPSCGDCGKDESELGETNRLEDNLSGDHCVCRDCIAQALLRTRGSACDRFHEYQPEKRTQAHLIATHAYELTNCWFSGTYGRGAYAALEAERLAHNVA